MTPKLYVYFRKQGSSLPATIDPANLDPSQQGIQVSSIRTWQMAGTPSMEFAVVGSGPQKSPTSTPASINPLNVWSLMGCEIRAYLDYRTTPTAFDPAGISTCPLIFCGDVLEIRPAETTATPWHAFSCTARGLMNRAERVPVVSSIDNSDTVRFNINALSSDYQPTTGGKTVGQAIQLVLENYAVAYKLDSLGIGGYTLNSTTQTATLPASTLTDLGNMSLDPPFEFRISGDNLVAAIQQVIDATSPNFGMVILPTGIIRFYDIRQYQAKSLDLQSQPIDGFSYSKSVLGSYSRVIVRGGPKVTPYYCQWSIPRSNSTYNLDDSPDNARFNGSLIEYFDSSNLTNTQSKVAYKLSDFGWGRKLLSTGDLYYTSGNTTLPSNQVRLVPDTGNISGRTTPNLKVWNVNELTMIDGTAENRRECRLVVRRKLNKTDANGTVNLRVDSGEFLISANDEMNSTASGCNITTAPNVDRPPPVDANYSYTSRYELYGNTINGSVGWRRYKVQLDDIAANSTLTTTQKGMRRTLGTVFPTGAQGLYLSQIGANTTSYEASQSRRAWYPECLVEYRQRSGGVWRYDSFWAGFRIDPVNNIIVLTRPSVVDASGNFTTGNYTDKTPPWDTGPANGTSDQPFQIVPYNIKALLPVYEGTQEASYPHYQANGTIAVGETESKVKSIYGISRDLIVNIPDWYDNRDQAYADQYAKELWDSVQQPQIEGGFAWIDGIPDTSADWDYRGLLSNNKVQAFTVTVTEDCNASTGSGVEECSLVLSSAEIRYQSNRKPFTVAGFVTARPRAAVPMHDFHSYEDHLARDPNYR